MKFRFNNHSFDYLPFLMDADKEGAGGSAADDTSKTDTKDDTGANDAGSGADKTGDDGDNGTDKGKDETEIQKLIAEAVAREVEGLKKKRDELIDANRKLKEKVEKAPQLSDDEYKQFLEIKARMERDELLALLAQGKSEEAIAVATRRTKAEMDASLTAEREEKERIKQEAAQARSELENMKIQIAVTSAAAPVVKQNYQGLVQQLVRDRVKVVDGHARVVDEQGEVVMKGGKPVQISDLIESLRPQYPDLFLPTAGGGAGGSSTKTNNSGGKLSMEALADLDPAEIIRLRNAGKI